MRHVAIALALLATSACDGAAPGSFPPEDPGLAARNEAAGDPHRGRFPFAAAVAGLPETGTLRATIVTDEGEIHCELLADVAPLAVANFVGLARGLRPFLDTTGAWTTRPYYEGLTFHRAEPRLFVQGGRLGDEELAGFRLQDERSIGTVFDGPGVLALANDGTPNSSSAQFFITTEVNRSFDGVYTIFGRCGDLLVVRELERRVLAGERPVIEAVRISRE
ncbi:peptidylprolyl isomerase [Nannocystaceae bacterium ST9]